MRLSKISHSRAVGVFFFVHFIFATFADSVSNWTNPNGKLPSFTESYTVGEQIILSWLHLNDSKNDLWLTRYNTSTDDYAVRLEVALDVSTPGSYKWPIAVDAEDVQKDTRFRFQFLPVGMAYDAQSPLQLASPGVNVLTVNMASPPNGTAVASSASSATQTSSTTDVSSSSGTVSSSSTTQSTDPETPTAGMSTGAKAGVAVAVILLALGSALAAFIVWKRRHRKTIDISDESSEKAAGPYEMLADRNRPIELDKDTMVHELNDSRFTCGQELNPSELPQTNSVLKRPGIHELAS